MRAFTAVALGLGSASIIAFAAYGCSSSSPQPVPTGPCEGPGCPDAGAHDTGGVTDAFPSDAAPTDAGPTDAGPTDAGPTEDVVGDGPHDGGAPDALYGACALQGSFGWPCHLTVSGPDPTDCTDPTYTECFVGGQASWCTKTCTTSTDCTTGVEDAGCIPTGCNARGYCK